MVVRQLCFGCSPPAGTDWLELKETHECMKVLLRDENARLYYGADDRWVADPNVAIDFQVLERAGQKALERPTQTLVVVLKYENPECELALNPIFCFNRSKT